MSTSRSIAAEQHVQAGSKQRSAVPRPVAGARRPAAPDGTPSNMTRHRSYLVCPSEGKIEGSKTASDIRGVRAAKEEVPRAGKTGADARAGDALSSLFSRARVQREEML